MKTVLIVDDSKAMRLIVRRTLRQAGYDVQVVEATNGKEALDMILASEPALVLSDWNMPEMTGIELLTELRRRESKVRFGFITTEGTPPMRDSAAAAGALFLIAKPFGVEAFEQALKPVLG